MFQSESLGFIVIFLCAFVLFFGPFSSRFPKKIAGLILLALLAHTFGSLARYGVLHYVYSGGDAGRYFHDGINNAERIRKFDFSFLKPSSSQFTRGTQMLIIVSSFVIFIIGPIQLGGFLIFSVVGLCGLLLMCKTFQINFPHCDLTKYSRWLLLWPSLCFWPSSVGKDALILFATCLVIYGYCTKTGKIAWGALITGFMIATLIRPQVAGVLAVAGALAHWSTKRRFTAIHVIQGILILGLAFFVLKAGFSALSIDEFDVENLTNYLQTAAVRSSEGGSNIGTPGLTPWSVPVAIVNILFRPFPWEATSPLLMAACAEMVFFWAFVFSRRHKIRKLIPYWRSNRLLQLAVPLTALYVIGLGLSIGNLGIIARQRIHVMPLLILLLAAEAPSAIAKPTPRTKQLEGQLIPQTALPISRP